MRYLLFAVLALTVMMPAAASEEPGTQSFDKLHDALDFLDQNLASRDWQTLTKALYPNAVPGELNRTEWSNLGRNLHGKLLTTLWADTEFPAGDESFVLKVPRGNLVGGSRIKFVNVEGHWHLGAVFSVR